MEYPLAPSQILYPYKFWIKKDLKLCIFSLPNTKFSQARALATPKSYVYVWILTEKGLKMCIYGFPNTHSLMKRRAAPLRPHQKLYYLCNFKLKMSWNYAYLTCKIQNTKFAKARGRCPFATPKWYISINFTERTEMHLWFPKYNEREVCPLVITRIISFL